MRLRSPAEYYIKYLVLHPDKYSTATIKERLLDEGLDFISDRYIDGLRKKLNPPDPFFPGDPNHAASYSFIIRERVNRMFQRDISMKMALEILETPRAKEFVESMALVHVPMAAISSFVSRHRGVYCTPEALDLYCHYFWNVNLLDSTQMRVLLQMRIDVAVENIPELRGQEKALKTAYYKDPRRVAADLPYSPTTAALTQMRLGVKPGKYDLALRMMEARDMAAARAVEAAQQDGPGDSQKFLNYANGSRILEELLQMVVKPEDDMREQLQSIALRTDTRALPTIHQLSDGHHTVDLAPMKDRDDDADELEPESGDLDSGERADS